MSLELKFKEWLGSKNGIVLFDGAMGSELQKRNIKEVPESLNLEKADVVSSIHKSYIEAGADIITTNTFGASKLKLKNYGLEDKLDEIIKSAVKLAKAEADKKGCKVAFDAGPTGKLMKPYGEASFEEIYDAYKEIALSVKETEADLVILETFSQLGEIRAAFLAFKENTDLPIVCSMTFEESGKSLTGVSPSAFALTMEGMGAAAVGVNCSVGPDKLVNVIKEIKKYTVIPVLAMPNAGLPRFSAGKTVWDMDADKFLNGIHHIVEAGADILGGCCGTTPEYINTLRNNIDELNKIRTDNQDLINKENLQHATADLKVRPSFICSQSKVVMLDDDIKVVGERINPTGRKVMRESLKNGDYDVIYKEAMAQVEAGADILDVNVSVPGLDEVKNMCTVLPKLQNIVDVPLQIDSSDPKVLEEALRIYNGVALVNSVNAKESSMREILPIIKKYGASVVALTIDKEIPKTAEERWELALKIIETAKEYGIDKSKIIIDSLTMTASAAQEYVFETLRALQIARDNGVKTILGVSNVSFGLPNRKILNSTFLSMAFGYGLNLAIINPLDEVMMDDVMAARVILDKDVKCNKYVEYALNKPQKETVKSAPSIAASANAGNNNSNESDAKKGNVTAKKSSDNKEFTLQDCIIKGLKDDAVALLIKKLDEGKKIEIVDEDIVPALNKVGDLYEVGKIFLPQLLQSAEVVQSLFEKIKERIEIKQGRGKIVIATVEGDIHDIGKNIVKVMLQNSGYDVIDLGSDAAVEKVVAAVKEHKPKLVGLSALMTTTVPAMQRTIEEVKKENLNCKFFVGGAVLTKETAEEIGADFYSKDAVESVKLADKVFSE